MRDFSQTVKMARRYIKSWNKEEHLDALRVAVLGSASIQHYVMILRYLLHEEGIEAEVYEGEYNGIAMDVFDSDSVLYRFNPETVIILPHYTDIHRYPVPMDGEQETAELVQEYVEFYTNVWNSIASKCDCRILQANFVIPPEHVLGNMERGLLSSKTSFLQQLNEDLYRVAPENVTIVDVELLAQYIGKYQYIDYSSYFLNKMPCRLDLLPEFCSLFVRLIAAMKGHIRKCLVLDLDNTLWGGVVGDDGWDGIQLDPNEGTGEAYRYFQQYVLALKQRGVILAVCSKNDEDKAKEPFENNPHMLLRLEDISCFVANWEDKASNLQMIAQKLNIGVDSLVFFDDNPAEREIVRLHLPQVHVVDVPEDAALYVATLDREAPFEWLQLTKEDLLRSDSYVRNQQRENMQRQFVDYNAYLQALEMSGSVHRVGDKEIPRFSQLLNKSNQFNLRTQRYTEDEICSMQKDKNVRCLCGELSDKFSSYGIISCVILKKTEELVFIDSWVMSCRVLKRGVEYMMFRQMIAESEAVGCREIVAEYIPTTKNGMVQDFYEGLGFDLCSEQDGVKRYRYDLSKPFNKDIFIQMALPDKERK